MKPLKFTSPIVSPTDQFSIHLLATHKTGPESSIYSFIIWFISIDRLTCQHLLHLVHMHQCIHFSIQLKFTWERSFGPDHMIIIYPINRPLVNHCISTYIVLHFHWEVQTQTFSVTDNHLGHGKICMSYFYPWKIKFYNFISQTYIGLCQMSILKGYAMLPF